MIPLLKFELKRFVQNKVNWLFIGILIVGLCILFSLHIKNESTFMIDLSTKYAQNKSYSQSITVSYGKMLDKEIAIGNYSLEKMAVIRDFYDLQTRDEQSLALFYSKDNAKDYEYLNVVKNKLFTRILQGLEDGISNEQELKLRGYEPSQLKLEIDYTQYLIDQKIIPNHNAFKVDGANGLKMFFSANYVMFILAVILFMVIEIYVKELMEGSYKLYQTLPWSRQKLFLARGTFVVLLGLVVLIFSSAFYFILCMLKGGIGDFSYPIMSRASMYHLTSDGMAANLLVVPVWQYILGGFTIVTLLILFSVALVNLFALILDSQSKTLGLVIMVVMFAFVANSFLSKEISFNFWYPYAYIFVDKVLQVQNRGNLIMGILLNLVGAVAVFIVSYRLYVKKDFVGAND